MGGEYKQNRLYKILKELLKILKDSIKLVIFPCIPRMMLPGDIGFQQLHCHSAFLCFRLFAFVVLISEEMPNSF